MFLPLYFKQKHHQQSYGRLYSLHTSLGVFVASLSEGLQAKSIFTLTSLCMYICMCTDRHIHTIAKVISFLFHSRLIHVG